MAIDAGLEDVVRAASNLAPAIRGSRGAIETDGRLPSELVEKLDNGGLFRLSLPRSMGGPECDPLTTFRAVEELSRADGSVGWCSMLSSTCSLFAGYLPVKVGKEMFGDPPTFRMAGSIRPEGRAVEVDGGYRVSGHWDYASGIYHANWLMCTCVIEDGNGPRSTGGGVPETRTLLAPVATATIVDNWSTVGLRGTGSHDFMVDDIFVPAEHSYLLFSPPQETGPLYHPRLSLIAAWAPVAANSLGMARGAMDAFLEIASDTGSTGSTTPLKDRPAVQTKVAEAEAIIGAARAYVVDSVGSVWNAVCQGVEDLDTLVARARLSITHAIWESVKAVDLLFHAAGTNAVHRRHPLERFFRDVHTAAQHVGGSPANIDAAGQALLGLRPGIPGW